MAIDFDKIPCAGNLNVSLVYNPQDGYALEDIAPGGDNIYRVMFVMIPTKVVTFDKPIVAGSREGAVLLAAAEYSITIEEATATRVIVKFVSHL